MASDSLIAWIAIASRRLLPTLITSDHAANLIIVVRLLDDALIRSVSTRNLLHSAASDPTTCYRFLACTVGQEGTYGSVGRSVGILSSF